MTVANNLYSDISSFVNTVWEGALLIARDNNVMAPLVTQFGDRSGMAVRTLSYYATGATINSIGEDDDMTSQAWTPSSLASLTPAEVGAQYVLTDLRLESDIFDVRTSAQQELGAALGESVEDNLLGHFDEFTVGTIGTSGSVLTWGYFFAMQAKLRHAKVPKPWNFVCTPYQWYAIMKDGAAGTTAGADNLKNDLYREIPWYMGDFYGISCFNSVNCEASSTDAYAGMFNKQALALDWRRAPRIEPQRDSSRRSWELNLSAVYAHGVWRAAYGCAGLFANSAPTGV